MSSAILRLALAGALAPCFASAPAVADEPSPAAPIVKLLKSGRLPPERQGSAVKLVCQRGDAADLEYILERCLTADGFTPEARLLALEGMADAALTRQVQPRGDLKKLGQLIRADSKIDAVGRAAALRLAGVWKVEALGKDLREIALAPKTPDAARLAALNALGRLGGKEDRQAIEKATEADRPVRVRYLGVAALARLDSAAAAARAAEALAKASDADDPGPLVDAFLDFKGGSEKLAAALVKQKPPADVAKLALRHLYAVGRSDAELSAALSDAAGVSVTFKKPDSKLVEAIVKEAPLKGDPARGEKVFRRLDLSCSKCHSLNGAGGAVGPDLRAVGSSSPLDYLVYAVLDPDRDIKEEFLTLRITTGAGRQYQGVLVEENDARLVLKDATGELQTIPKKDIDEREKGGSLMPKGLANFMTHAELIDLVRFLSELGKPGDYAVQTAPVLRRWRLFSKPDEALLRAAPDEATFKEQVLQAEPTRWTPVYAKVSGVLPLAELPGLEGGKVLYVQGEIDVKEGGKVGVGLDSAAGLHLWIDDKPADPSDKLVAGLTRGRHKLTFRIDLSKRGNEKLKAELFKVEGSDAEAAVVGGP
jgi:putative heme-binding domain-containing protein